MTRILVADDQALVRAGLRKILESEPDFDVVGEAGDGGEAVDAAQRLLPGSGSTSTSTRRCAPARAGSC